MFEYFSKKTVQKIQAPLKSDKNNDSFTLTVIYIYSHISINSS